MASRSKSGSKSFKSTSSKAMNFFSGNSLLTNLAIFITIAVSVSYLAKQHFYALIMLYGVAAIIFLISKNVLMSLALAIILTNLFAPPPVKRVKFFREGNQNMSNKEEHLNNVKDIKKFINSSEDLKEDKKVEMRRKITQIITDLEDETTQYPRARFKNDLDALQKMYPYKKDDPNKPRPANMDDDGSDILDNLVKQLNNPNSPPSNQQGFKGNMTKDSSPESVKSKRT